MLRWNRTEYERVSGKFFHTDKPPTKEGGRVREKLSERRRKGGRGGEDDVVVDAKRQ